jgi:D-alanyl-D-alanine-carboxypeptidase/D-alanyl-D-alanine-endopeptidase
MKRKVSIFFHLFIAFALCACGIAIPSPMPSSPAKTKSSRLPDPNLVKALLVRVVDEERLVPGIVVGMIADDPQERWVVGYGKLSNTDERVPDADTVFEIGSITKVFTGTLLAQAMLNGEVKLDDPISMYFPEGITAPEYEGRPITLLDLATHYSSLPPFTTTNLCIDYTMDQMYDFLPRYRLTRASGSSYEYSNMGFAVLSDLLVRRAGEADYEALLLERITRPLGMDSTRVQLTPEMQSCLAAPHANYFLPSCSDIESALFGAGGIRSTANDMLTFLAANMGLTETELQPAFQLANTPQRPTVGPGYGPGYIGLGWFVPESGQGMHTHGGLTAGYNSFLAWDSERRIGIVMLANASINTGGIGLFLMSESARLVDTIPQADPQVLATYAGRYQFPDGFVMTIRVDGTHIFIQAPNKPENELIAISKNQFFIFDNEFTFYTNDRGEVDRMEMMYIWGTSEAKKVP